MKEEWNKKKSICNNVENSITAMEQYKVFDSLIQGTKKALLRMKFASITYVASYTYSVKIIIVFLVNHAVCS